MWIFPPGLYYSWLIILILFIKDFQLCQIAPHTFCINTQATEMFRNAVCSLPFCSSYDVLLCSVTLVPHPSQHCLYLLFLLSPSYQAFAARFLFCFVLCLVVFVCFVVFCLFFVIFLWDRSLFFSEILLRPSWQVSCAWNYSEDVSVSVAIKKK